jgi:LuxR family maltose regulon positive regulatory protein
MENIDTPADCELLFARLRLARGDVGGAVKMVASAEKFVQQNNFVHLIPDIAAIQVLISLQRDEFENAAKLAEKHKLPISQARVYLAQGDALKALTVLKSYRQQVEEKGRCDKLLRAIVLQATALHAHGKEKQSLRVLGEALTLAEAGSLIRVFVDEGAPMADLLSKAATQKIMPNFVNKLLIEFITEEMQNKDKTAQLHTPALIEPLSERELEILRLIAQGLSNREIGERLFLALNTIKGHNRRIFSKLQVQRRTEAVARARELKLL